MMVSPGQSERLKALYGLTVFGFALDPMTGWLMMKHSFNTAGCVVDI